MTRFKLRTATAVLAAAFTMAVSTGPFAPAAQAKPNDGGYQDSVEAKKKQRCQLLHDLWSSDVMVAINAQPGISPEHDAEGQAVADEYEARAERDEEYARNAGCAWAQ
jgi:hypothetical protein